MVQVTHADALAATDTLSHARRLSELSDDPVIFIDTDRVPCWANPAALALHGASDAKDLGSSLREYLGRFETYYRDDAWRTGSQAAGPVLRLAGSDGHGPPRFFKLAETVLRSGEHVTGYVIVLTALDGVRKPASASTVRRVLGSGAAALVRCSDQMVMQTNEAFLGLTGRCGCCTDARPPAALGIPAALLAGPDTIRFPTLSRLQTANGQLSQAVLVNCVTESLDGEEFRLYTFSTLDPHLTAAVLAHSLEEDSPAIFDLICGTVAAPVFVLDADRRVISASEELLRLLSYAARDFVGRPIAEFLGGSSMQSFKEVFWPSLSDCSVAEDPACDLMTGKGHLLRVRLTGRPVLDADQAVRRATCVVEDLTGRNFGEMNFSTLFSLSPVPMAIRRLDDARILDVNPAFLSMTGHSVDAVVGRLMDELMAFEPSHLRPRFERDLRNGLPLRAAEMRVKAHDGSLMEVKATGAAVQAFGHKCVLLILHETAQGRFDEQQLFKAIETVMSDTSWFSRQVVEKLATVRTPRASNVRQGELNDLTKREREVLAMISHGWSDAEIAARLSLTRSTVRNHVAALYSKIEVHSRSSAIVWARERALNVIHPAAGFGQQVTRRVLPVTPDARCHLG